MKRSRKQQIGDLNVLWTEKEWEIAEVYASKMDPDIKVHYLSDLQYEQYCIEQRIDDLEHEQAMLPLQLMLAGFIIFVISMLIYRLTF
jgi:uncharacterized membrane protein